MSKQKQMNKDLRQEITWDIIRLYKNKTEPDGIELRAWKEENGNPVITRFIIRHEDSKNIYEIIDNAETLMSKKL